MLKIKKVKVLSVLLVGIIALCASALLFGIEKNKNVYAAEGSVGGIRTEYLFKDTVIVPEIATMTVDGENYESDSFYVILPDGNRISSAKLTLDVCGEYSIVYEKTINGKRYSAAKTFKAKKKVFELASGNDSI